MAVGARTGLPPGRAQTLGSPGMYRLSHVIHSLTARNPEEGRADQQTWSALPDFVDVSILAGQEHVHEHVFYNPKWTVSCGYNRWGRPDPSSKACSNEELSEVDALRGVL